MPTVSIGTGKFGADRVSPPKVRTYYIGDVPIETLEDYSISEVVALMFVHLNLIGPHYLNEMKRQGISISYELEKKIIDAFDTIREFETIK